MLRAIARANELAVGGGTTEGAQHRLAGEILGVGAQAAGGRGQPALVTVEIQAVVSGVLRHGASWYITSPTPQRRDRSELPSVYAPGRSAG